MWLASAVTLIVVVVGVAKFIERQSVPLTGTNSVDVGAVVVRPQAGQTTCLRGLSIPGGTGRIQIWAGLQEVKRASPTIVSLLKGTSGRPQKFTESLGGDAAGKFRDVATLSPAARAAHASLCFRASGTALDLGGATVNAFSGQRAPTIDGRAIQDLDVAVRYLSPVGHKQRLLSRIGPAFARAALFKDLPGGGVSVGLLLAALFLGLPYLAVRTTATLPSLNLGNLVRRAVLLSAVTNIAWAAMLPPLHGADESEHLAYVQYVAETGHRADSAPSVRQPYSSDELTLMGAIRHSSTVLNDSSRVRWDKQSELAYRQAIRSKPSRSNGGGFTESASGHSPLYYGLLALPYRLVSGSTDLPQLLEVLRITTAVLAAIIAGLAVWCASLVAPRRAWLWWLAGLLVACQPVFASISGTVNNDTLVNLLSATTVALCIRVCKRDARWWHAALLGLTTALLPVAKITGFAIWPVVGVALGIAVIERRSRGVVWHVIAALSAVALTVVSWIYVLAPALAGSRGALLNAHASSDGAAPAAATNSGISLPDHINYVVQMVLPVVHLGKDVWAQPWPLYSIYVERGYGRFGWLDAGLPDAALLLVTAALGCGWIMVAVAAWCRRGVWKQWVPYASIMIVTIVAVLTFVGVAYTATAPRDVPGEQGRYFFPAILPASILLAAGLDPLRTSVRTIALGGIAVLLPAFAAYAWLAALADYYT
ncbi:DUF2142 domain-containing protein [Paraconexibacter antarcticus]|uniref:DUF2142 domain-containing protein n=1 Tax=Paraconexibacter antarcticus TaxID=2949664 RepID=A0ABY5DUV3_9ACTN|nr:DUF2142 domain-containing protein [Paraconexibacter antarcticus]UTI65083.1 DUF2142 domain-containing protein [Paraconexibacter antarcticus]